VIVVRPSLVRLLLLLAFFLSGSSGLIYETVWVRMLTRYVGATTYATSTVLAVFMGGLALGSYLGGRVADRTRRPLRAYAVLEVATAITGLLSSFAVIGGLGGLYVSVSEAVGEAPTGLLLVRVVFVVLCLLPPAVLMGATLPLLVSFVGRLGQHVQVGLGRLYAINTLGAVAGVFAAGLVLIGEFGESASLGVAAGLNLLAALLVFGLREPTPAVSVSPTVSPEPAEIVQPYAAAARRVALAAFVVSGFSALAYEILWTRYLVLVLQTSIYAFSVMLGTFLVGIALGSWLSSRRPGLRRAPLVSFALLEILIGLWTVGGLLLLPAGNRVWLALGDSAAGEWGQMGVGALICAIMVLPIAVMFGVQFPIAVRCCQARPDAPGRSTGQAYAANTLGTIAGAVSAGFLLIPLLGTSHTMVLVAALNLVMGLLLLAVAPATERGRLTGPALALAGGFAALALLVGDPYQTIMAARMRHLGPGWEVFRSFERATATTVAAGDRSKPRDRALLVNGYGMTTLCTETKIMTHLPYLLADDPKRLLVICFGMGTTYHSACLYPELRVDAVDIVPEVFDCYEEFHPDAASSLNRPNAYRHVDDGRNYLLTHPDKYDIITIDPAPPLHSAGTVNLYTREFFQLCKDRLTPGGVLSMWVPPARESEVKMIMRSFVEVFPEGGLWGALEFQGFYLIGGHRPLGQTSGQVAEIARKLSEVKELGDWKGGVDYTRRQNLEKLYLADGAGLAQMVRDARPVTDDHPYTEFPLWRRVFSEDGRRVFEARVVRERLNRLAQAKP
jgi:predicted membrane-bound spermidine synthase